MIQFQALLTGISDSWQRGYSPGPPIYQGSERLLKVSQLCCANLSIYLINLIRKDITIYMQVSFWSHRKDFLAEFSSSPVCTDKLRTLPKFTHVGGSRHKPTLFPPILCCCQAKPSRHSGPCHGPWQSLGGSGAEVQDGGTKGVGRGFKSGLWATYQRGNEPEWLQMWYMLDVSSYFEFRMW